MSTRRPLNPYAQPYFAHHLHPNQSFLCEVPTYMQKQNPTMNHPDHHSHMEAADIDQNPRGVVQRRKKKNFRRERNVGPRLWSPRTSLAENFVEVSRAATGTRVWKPKEKASNFASNSNWGGTVDPSTSRPGRSRGTREVGMRFNLGPSHGVQASSFPSGKGSVIPFPESPDEQNGSEVTTLMIKNIPYQLRKSDLLLILKDHCELENKKTDSLPKSEVNFFYLPLDFKKFWKTKTISNLGYAFVNFTSAVGAFRYYKAYHKSVWSGFTGIQSPKICEISCAKIQGFKALRKWFRGKAYHGLTNDFLPVILDPACDGLRESNQIPVGRLLGAERYREI